MSPGEYVFIALLGAGATYGLMQRGKPKPDPSTRKRNWAIALFGFAAGCFLLAVGLALLAHHAASR